MKKGFTLIELLVVISIIGLLSSVVLSSLSSARMKARDTAKIRSLLEMRTALQLYYTDNGYYPSKFIYYLVPNYISKVTYSGLNLSLYQPTLDKEGFLTCEELSPGVTRKCQSYYLAIPLEDRNNSVLKNDVNSVPDPSAVGVGGFIPKSDSCNTDTNQPIAGTTNLCYAVRP